MAKGIKRSYKVSDEALLERAYLFHDMVKSELGPSKAVGVHADW